MPGAPVLEFASRLPEHRRMQNATATIVLTETERATLAQLRLAIGGIWRACAQVGVSRDTYERAAGGLGIRRGSAALIRIAIAQIDPSALDTLHKATA